MAEFKNVTVVVEANIYYEGRVTSRTLIFEDGERKTLGFMLPGEYAFNTGAPEIMEIIAGSMLYKLPGAEDWSTAKAGESFSVPGDTSFTVLVSEYADYCCSFVG
ncbi:MAG: hypothetical protein C0609_02685 [Deltaproteobacteria bacterium]|nr:MAG: hypothetical protein C0609_02685 [Deltaproteobacteria bacterium]